MRAGTALALYQDATFKVANIFGDSCNAEQVDFLVDNNVIPALLESVTIDHPPTIAAALDALLYLCQQSYGRDVAEYVKHMEDSNLVYVLFCHADDAVQQRAATFYTHHLFASVK